MAVLKAGKREVLLCFLMGTTLCLPDVCQVPVTETSHSVVGHAGLQGCSSAGDTQTGIQPSHLAGTTLVSVVGDWDLSPKPESRES